MKAHPVRRVRVLREKKEVCLLPACVEVLNEIPLSSMGKTRKEKREKSVFIS
jgi:hypothetical protein